MATLSVDLQDGFDHDAVVVLVDGQEVYRNEDVHTQLLLGVADTFEEEVKDGEIEVEVHLPRRALQATFKLGALKKSYLGLSIREGALHHQVSPGPFGYG